MITCLTVPYFAAAVERRHDGDLAQTPLVVGGQPWEPRPLFGFSQEAARRGVRPGMPLRQAHVLSPGSCFLPAEPARYLSAAGELIDTLTDFTPLVAPEDLWQPPAKRQSLPAGARTLPARYTVDLEGLPQQEAVLLTQEMGRAVRRETGLEAAIGVAADPFTAQVAATLVRPSHVRPVETGAEREFLATCSLSFLPLEKETARRLRLLGIRTLGQLAALSPAAVREQFGSEALPLYRLACGETAPQAPAPAPPTEETVARHFEPPLADWLAVENVLNQMAAVLADRLAEAGLAGRSLHLLVEEERDSSHRLSLPFRRPARAAGRLGQAACDLARSLSITAGITALSLSLDRLAPAAARQLSLFEQPARSAGIDGLAQMMARHQTAQFLQPVLINAAHPLPEERFRLQPVR